MTSFINTSFNAFNDLGPKTRILDFYFIHPQQKSRIFRYGMPPDFFLYREQKTTSEGGGRGWGAYVVQRPHAPEG